MAVAKKTPAKRGAAKKVVAKKVEEVVEAKDETIVEEIKEVVEKVETAIVDEVKKVENAFESWWNTTALGLLRQGHSEKNILISAAEQSEADYSTFVKKEYGAALEKHGKDLKKIAEVAFNTKK